MPVAESKVLVILGLNPDSEISDQNTDFRATIIYVAWGLGVYFEANEVNMICRFDSIQIWFLMSIKYKTKKLGDPCGLCCRVHQV